jgi:predicted amidohydrolase
VAAGFAGAEPPWFPIETTSAYELWVLKTRCQAPSNQTCVAGSGQVGAEEGPVPNCGLLMAILTPATMIKHSDRAAGCCWGWIFLFCIMYHPMAWE